jgi:hypothetical protein
MFCYFLDKSTSNKPVSLQVTCGTRISDPKFIRDFLLITSNQAYFDSPGYIPEHPLAFDFFAQNFLLIETAFVVANKFLILTIVCTVSIYCIQTL